MLAGPKTRNFFCRNAHTVTWAVRYDTKALVGDEMTRTIIHSDPRGEVRVTSLVPSPFPANYEGTDTFGFDRATVFDFDGDGDPELLLTPTYAGYAVYAVDTLFVTFKRGGIELFVPTGARVPLIDHAEDVDGDGRPDLVGVFSVGCFKECDWGEWSAVEESFVAHSLPDGTFSMNDAQAQAFARKRCPYKPDTTHLIAGSPPDSIVDEGMLRCARLWGATSASLKADLARQCAPYAQAAAACRGPCRYREVLEASAAFDPPLSLN